jgi:hypothetical protein
VGLGSLRPSPPRQIPVIASDFGTQFRSSQGPDSRRIAGGGGGNTRSFFAPSEVGYRNAHNESKTILRWKEVSSTGYGDIKIG